MNKTTKLLTIAAAGLLATALSATAQEKVPLKLELPKPMFVGTPVPVKLPHLEKPLGKARPDIMIPAGCTNLAADKEVTGSDMEPVIGDLEFLTDGDKDGADGSYVELGPKLQWAQIDLEKESEIHAIVIWHFHKNARAYHDVIVQVSNDKDFLTGVTTIFNNDHDNSAAKEAGKDKAYIETNEGKLIAVDGAKGQYLRFYSNGNTANEMNHYVEIEVHGK